MAEDLSLEQALAKNDTRNPWPAKLNDPVRISWPAHWKSGVLSGSDVGGTEEVENQIKSNTFEELMDKLFDEILDLGCRGWTLRKTDWIAMVPQENLDLDGRGIGIYTSPATVQDIWIPWQWWQPFLIRLEERLKIQLKAANTNQGDTFSFQRELLDFNRDITLKNKISVQFRVRISIGQSSASQVKHCAIQFMNQ